MKLCRAQGEIAQRIAPHNLAAHPAEYGLRPIPPYGDNRDCNSGKVLTGA
jgi:hypothetical protein